MQNTKVAAKTGLLAIAAGILLSGCVETTTGAATGAMETSAPAPTSVSTGRTQIVSGNGRFPAVDPARLQTLVGAAYCANRITTIARSAGQTDTHRGYAIQICNPDREKEGVAVAWIARRGNAEIIVARPDGTILPRRAGNYNIGSQQTQAGVFGISLSSGPAACYVPRSNHMTEPFASTFCNPIER